MSEVLEFRFARSGGSGAIGLTLPVPAPPVTLRTGLPHLDLYVQPCRRELRTTLPPASKIGSTYPPVRAQLESLNTSLRLITASTHSQAQHRSTARLGGLLVARDGLGGLPESH